MTKPLSSKQLLFPGITAIFVLIAACNSGPADKAQPAQPAEAAQAAQPAPVYLLSGKLDTLFARSADFANLSHNFRTVFEFRIGGLDTLTMDGWTAPLLNQNPFPTNPNISLLKGRSSNTQTYGPGTYLGNQVLHQQQLKQAQDFIAAQKAPFVLFVPNKDNGHVYYTIFAGFDDPKATSNTFLTTPVNSGVSSNPSPPKNYSN